MIRKFKMLGLALVAVLALTAVAASGASAASYTASTYPTTGTAESAVGNDTFITAAGKVECKAHYEGTLGATSSTLTVKATYTNCKAFGFLTATVNMGSCDYLFTQPTGSGHEFVAAVDVKCTDSTKPITIVASTCETTIGEQNPKGQVNITNNTAAGDVFVKAGVTGIAYTVTKSGIGCPFNSSGGTGPRTGAEYIQDEAITFDSTNGATIDVG